MYMSPDLTVGTALTYTVAVLLYISNVQVLRQDEFPKIFFHDKNFSGMIYSVSEQVI